MHTFRFWMHEIIEKRHTHTQMHTQNADIFYVLLLKRPLAHWAYCRTENIKTQSGTLWQVWSDDELMFSLEIGSMVWCLRIVSNAQHIVYTVKNVLFNVDGKAAYKNICQRHTNVCTNPGLFALAKAQPFWCNTSNYYFYWFGSLPCKTFVWIRFDSRLYTSFKRDYLSLSLFSSNLFTCLLTYTMLMRA